MWQAAALRRILAAAALAGILAGLMLTVLQQFTVVPVLREAEVYEHAALPALAPATPPGHADSHHPSTHDYATELRRTALTTVSNVTLAVGLALLLGAAMHIASTRLGVRVGMVWGLAGYLTFFLAPSLGLPPELPGTASAALAGRQAWWLAAALSTASGLALLAYGRSNALRLLAVVVLALPHLIGAPQPDVHASTAPESLARVFALTTAAINLLFWLSLGSLYGYVLERQQARGNATEA